MVDKLNFSLSKRVRQVMQSETAECGLACIAMIANYYGCEVDLPALRRRFGTSTRGVTLAQLMDVADALGFKARAMRAELSYLNSCRKPVLLHWNMDHFVVLSRVRRARATIHDPARGEADITMSELSSGFTGFLLEIEPKGDFAPTIARESLTLRRFLGGFRGIGAVLLQLLILTVVLEVLTLAVPLHLQITIDQVLATNDSSLLVMLAVAFAAVALFTTLVLNLRGFVLSWAGAALTSQATTNLARHLLSLPVEFFFRRSGGDVLSRLSSVRNIQSGVTGNTIETIMDGSMSIVIIMLVALYSSSLALVVTGCGMFYVILRLCFHRHLRSASENRLVHYARQMSELMESVRAIAALKLANHEARRVSRIAEATVSAARSDALAQRIALCLSALGRGLQSVQRIAIVAIGSVMVMQDRLSPGSFVATVAFAELFGSRFCSFVDRIAELRILGVHLERVSDIALSEPEEFRSGVYSGPDPSAEIELRNLGYRYSRDTPWIFRGINLKIGVGESLAITGESGCGKSTLARILMGLVQPTEGAVLVGGIDIRHLGLPRYRTLVSAVMQDDQLLSGSIAENISFFDNDATLDAIRSAARTAQIDGFVSGLPMGYETLIDGAATSISGGQKQRILLARALFRQARIMVLDEATSHLDLATELNVVDSIKQLRCTRIVVAHRPQTISACDSELRIGAISKSKLSDGSDGRDVGIAISA